MITVATLGGALLVVMGAFGSTMNKGGWAAEAAAETGPITIGEAQRGSFGGRLETLMSFCGHNGKFLLLLALAGTVVLIEIVVMTVHDLTQFATVALEGLARFSLVVVTWTMAALVIGITAVGTYIYDNRAEIWEGIKTVCYYGRELIALIADLLTIATVGVFGTVKFWAIDWWQSR